MYGYCTAVKNKDTIRNQRGFRALKKGSVHDTELKKGFEFCNEIETLLRFRRKFTKPLKKFSTTLTSLLKVSYVRTKPLKRFRIRCKKRFRMVPFFLSAVMMERTI